MCLAAAVAAATAVAPARADVAALDPNFGSGGVVMTTFSQGVSEGRAVAIDDQGRIVVAGRAGSDIAVARYLPSGTPDMSFDGDGKLVTAVGTFALASGIAIQPDGKILAVGGAHTIDDDFVVVRYTDTGGVDPAFAGGFNPVLLPNAGRDADSVLVQPDDKIVVAGAGTVSKPGFAIARLDSGGVLDNSFDGDGQATVYNDAGKCGASSSSGISALIRQPDGNILAGGLCGGVSTDETFGLARFSGGTTAADGALHTSFGTGGTSVVSPESGAPAFAAGLVRQSDGKLLQVGQSGRTSPRHAVVMRRNADGSVDPTYGAGGVRLFGYGGTDNAATSVVLGAREWPLVAGDRSLDGGFGLARLNASGTLDESFAPGGAFLLPFGEPPGPMQVSSSPSGMALQPDGKAVLVGGSLQGGSEVMTIMRFLVPPPTDPAGPAKPSSPPVLTLKIPKQTIDSVLRRGLAFRAACVDGCVLSAHVRGAVPKKKKRHAHHSRTALVGRLKSTLKAGVTRTLRVKLNRAGKAGLRGKKKATLRLTLVAANPSGGPSTTSTRAVHLKRAKHHKRTRGAR